MVKRGFASTVREPETMMFERKKFGRFVFKRLPNWATAGRLRRRRRPRFPDFV